MVRRSIPALVCLGLLTTAVVWFVRQRPAALPNRVYRVGFQHSPPRQYVTQNGQPYGPSIETVQEAARRAGIRLEWVLVPDGPDQALTTGDVDLWPLVASLPARRKAFYISDPFEETTFWLVSVKDHGVRHDAMDGKTVGRTDGLAAMVAEQFFPKSREIRSPDRQAMLRSLCAGEIGRAHV